MSWIVWHLLGLAMATLMLAKSWHALSNVGAILRRGRIGALATAYRRGRNTLGPYLIDARVLFIVPGAVLSYGSIATFYAPDAGPALVAGVAQGFKWLALPLCIAAMVLVYRTAPGPVGRDFDRDVVNMARAVACKRTGRIGSNLACVTAPAELSVRAHLPYTKPSLESFPGNSVYDLGQQVACRAATGTRVLAG